MGDAVRLKLTRKDFIIYLANHYTTRNDQNRIVCIK